MATLVQRPTLISRIHQLRSGILIASVVVTGCLGPFHPSLERRELAADPAATIRMPRTVELAHFSSERASSIDGPRYAFDRYLFGTDATFAAVVEFYSEELQRLGWTPDRFAVVSGTTDLGVRGWCKPRMAFRLAEKDKERAFDQSIFEGRTYATVYDAGLLSIEPDYECGLPPSRQRSG